MQHLLCYFGTLFNENWPNFIIKEIHQQTILLPFVFMVDDCAQIELLNDRQAESHHHHHPHHKLNHHLLVGTFYQRSPEVRMIWSFSGQVAARKCHFSCGYFEFWGQIVSSTNFNYCCCCWSCWGCWLALFGRVIGCLN